MTEPVALWSDTLKTPEGDWLPGEEICTRVREKYGPTVALGFSIGKDSIGAWLQLRRFFDRVVPIYREYVPGLEFVRRELSYYESFFQTEIICVPSEAMWEWLVKLDFQPPDRAKLIDDAVLFRDIGSSQIVDAAYMQAGLTPDIFIAGGWRRSDSIARAFAMKKEGPVNEGSMVFHPIYDWSEERLFNELKGSGVRLPPDYAIFGRSFDSLRGRFCVPLKKTFPNDYERLRLLFPLVDLEYLRFTEYEDRPYRERRKPSPRS